MSASRPPTPDAEWPSLRTVRLLVLDFDGVLTDNRVIVHQDGTESVACHRGDGMGMQMLMRSGVDLFVLSKQKNPVVRARCETLGVPFQQSTEHKLPALRAILDERGLAREQVAYMGNDVNDLDALEHAGISLAPADAEAEVLAMVDAVTTRPGGFGAVREVCDRMLREQRTD